MDDYSDIKRQHLLDKIRVRDQRNESILDRMGLKPINDENALICDSAEEPDVDIKKKPKLCSKCHGQGTIKPMFFVMECDSCYGTGYDLTNIIYLIKWQKLCLDWSKKKLLQLQDDVYKLSTTPEERMADSMDQLYKGKTFNRHE